MYQIKNYLVVVCGAFAVIYTIDKVQVAFIEDEDLRKYEPSIAAFQACKIAGLI